MLSEQFSLPLGGEHDTRARFGVGRRVVVTQRDAEKIGIYEKIGISIQGSPGSSPHTRG